MKLDPSKEEHLDGGMPRKAVGLFARDAFGTGVFELSAISTASGAILSTNAAGGSGGGTSTVYIANPVGNTTLNPSPNFIGIVTIANPASAAGMTTLFPSPNFIGIVTVANPGSAGMTTLFGGPNFIGIVTVANQPALVAGTAQIGSVTISNQPPLIASSAYVGLVSVSGNVVVSSLPALAAGTAQIGSVTISNPIITSVNSVASINGKVAIMNGSDMMDVTTPTNTFADGKNGIMALGRTKLSGASALGRSLLLDDLGAIVVGRSVTTQYAGYLSASGYSTIFVPPTGSRFFIHSAMINSQGQSGGFIGSASLVLAPWAGLATYGGFVLPTDNPGLPAVNVNEALTIRQFSLVTLSYQISVHFDQGVT